MKTDEESTPLEKKEPFRKGKRKNLNKRPTTFTDEQIKDLLKVLDYGTDPLTAAKSIGLDADLFCTTMRAASKDSRHPDRTHWKRITMKYAQFEVKLTNKWANNLPGGHAAESFLKATRTKFNVKAQMEIEANLRVACQIILEHACPDCRATLAGKIAEVGSMESFLDESETRMIK